MAKNEHILAIRASVTEGMKPNVLTNNPDVAPIDLWVGHREHLDSYNGVGDPAFRQVLPYVVIYNKATESLLGYIRSGTEERLNGKLSIGFGGHVCFKDAVGEGDELDLKAAILEGAKRELREELIIDGEPLYWAEIQDTGLSIACDRTEVDRLHIAYVCLTIIDIDPEEIKLGDHGLRLVHDAEYYLEQNPSSPIEEWSRIILKDKDLLPINDHKQVDND